MRFSLTVFSIALLLVLGHIGEEMINYLHSQVSGIDSPSLPGLTDFVYNNFRLNTGDFALSLTPFMILFLGLFFLSAIRRWGHASFIYAFMLLWMIASLYFSLFTAAVLLPHMFLMCSSTDSMLPNVVVGIDAILTLSLSSICGYFIYKRCKLRKSGQPDGGREIR